MSQGTYAGIHMLEDFLFGDIGITADAIADTAPEWVGQVVVGGNDDALTLVTTVDEPGGIMSITNDTGTTDFGWAMYSAPLVPQDGAAVIEVRLKYTDISGTNFFVGFVETFPNTDPDNIVPYTIATETISIANFGVTAGVFCDHNATNEDFYFAAAQDATGAAGVTLVSPAVGGGRTGVDLSGATGDNSWIVYRVEIEADGTAFGYVGSVHTDAIGGGEALALVGQTSRGALDGSAVVFPVVLVDNNAGSAMTTEVDYYAIRGDRDWTV
ncbi:hypothetical protein LCGC14_1351810 [marine sediment metagenome]|uniref:Uncharacterized protein n=1 Tax=marine sediment metagenome TaxID=412755 RepID=A0A0F9KBC9_9ZZZZ